MVIEGTKDIDNVVVCNGSEYIISQATFPTYFLKELTQATDTQIELDLDIYLHHIAPVLNVKQRFVGSEPNNSLTARYNNMMHRLLNKEGHMFTELNRLQDISASTLRSHLKESRFAEACRLAYPSTIPYLFSALAAYAMKQELDTTPKPGLVDRHDSGAHKDMDYVTMCNSIKALRPHFAALNYRRLNEKDYLCEAERNALEAMTHASHGVNTHKGAFFCMGLTILAAQKIMAEHGDINAGELQKEIRNIAGTLRQDCSTHGGEMTKRYNSHGALGNAVHGYEQLFNAWLPFYRNNNGDKWQAHKTLLYIMSTLDDTNILFRKGLEEAELVKAGAKNLLADFNSDDLWLMNERFIVENISPGGAADMLALTMLADKLIRKETENRKNL